eukprot:Plantae.Rhodophyta-Rhodochaete_pulchella.ctg6433.p1 GENE.Plantae.Rhodophyta-Rhodochaete_pulchella.ctg6433~~Plantae.Rhodophyta-Rhodochaete_pulchella.ctg6433.p1  ORF type:complete len:552 (-),score=71.44 Plantae.Rhodophyta-Rhodochaete_pulchella.ctg6433:1943-3598(-)
MAAMGYSRLSRKLSSRIRECATQDLGKMPEDNAARNHATKVGTGFIATCLWFFVATTFLSVSPIFSRGSGAGGIPVGDQEGAIPGSAKSVNLSAPLHRDIVHRGVSLEVLQVDLDPSSNQSSTFSLCRVYNICRSSAGLFYLFKSTPALLETIRTHCGSPPSFADLPDSTATHTIHDDLLAGRATTFRYHMPHFLDDFFPALGIWTALHFYTASLAQNFPSPSFLTHSAFDGDGKPTTISSPNGLRGAVIMDERYARQEPTSKWVRKFLDLIPQISSVFVPSQIAGVAINSSALSGSRQGDMDKEVITCFRSGVFENPRNRVRYPFGQFWGASEIRQSFYAVNELESEVQTPVKRCSLQVVVLDRQPGEARSIVDVEKLTDSLRSAKLSTTDGKDIGLSVRVARFASVSFEEQIETMQEAHVVLSVHGAELTNLVFARVGALVIEITPFGYSVGPFDSISRGVGLNHVRLRAAPDLTALRTCFQRHNRVNDSAVEELFRMVREHEPIILSTDYFLPALKEKRRCARSQRLAVDVDEILGAIQLHASGKLCI